MLTGSKICGPGEAVSSPFSLSPLSRRKVWPCYRASLFPSLVRLTNCPDLSGNFRILTLKVPRPRKPLSPGQTEMGGHTITWPHPRLQIEGLEMTRSSGLWVVAAWELAGHKSSGPWCLLPQRGPMTRQSANCLRAAVLVAQVQRAVFLSGSPFLQQD